MNNIKMVFRLTEKNITDVGKKIAERMADGWTLDNIEEVHGCSTLQFVREVNGTANVSQGIAYNAELKNVLDSEIQIVTTVGEAVMQEAEVTNEE